MNILRDISAVDKESYIENFDDKFWVLFREKIIVGVKILIDAHNCHHIM
jgi:hypothetical protein